MDRKTRNRDATRARIIAAVGHVLEHGGFRSVGINEIARAAGVDKVLIYRYFGSLSALLEAFAGESSVWPHIDELLADCTEALASSDPVRIATAVLLAHVRALRRRPLVQELMRWELLENNELTGVLARTREEQGLKLLGLLLRDTPLGKSSGDLQAAAALLLSGLTYLLLRSHTASVYLGVPLDSDAGWGRLEAAVERMVAATLAIASK
jgi:AcrR family transcriptional regulator